MKPAAAFWLSEKRKQRDVPNEESEEHMSRLQVRLKQQRHLLTPVIVIPEKERKPFLSYHRTPIAKKDAHLSEHGTGRRVRLSQNSPNAHSRPPTSNLRNSRSPTRSPQPLAPGTQNISSQNEKLMRELGRFQSTPMELETQNSAWRGPRTPYTTSTTTNQQTRSSSFHRSAGSMPRSHSRLARPPAPATPCVPSNVCSESLVAPCRIRSSARRVVISLTSQVAHKLYSIEAEEFQSRLFIVREEITAFSTSILQPYVQYRASQSVHLDVVKSAGPMPSMNVADFLALPSFIPGRCSSQDFFASSRDSLHSTDRYCVYDGDVDDSEPESAALQSMSVEKDGSCIHNEKHHFYL